MAARSLSLERNRKLTITLVGADANHSIQPPFVALLPSYNKPERQQVEALAKDLIKNGCVEFCCVGPQAEVLHDALDEIIETEGATDVVTTWFEDPTEASEYFLRAAAGGRANLLALVQSHSELQALLEDEVEHGGRVEPPT